MKKRNTGITIKPDVRFILKNVAKRRNAEGYLIWEYLGFSVRNRQVQTIECTPDEIDAALKAAPDVTPVSAMFLFQRGALGSHA